MSNAIGYYLMIKLRLFTVGSSTYKWFICLSWPNDPNLRHNSGSEAWHGALGSHLVWNYVTTTSRPYSLAARPIDETKTYEEGMQ